MTNKSRLAVALSVLALSVSLACPAEAYPTSIIFAPTGEAKPLGLANALIYTAVNLNPSPAAPGMAWFGANAGIVPAFKYGDSGTGFGGLEVGLDFITGSTVVKPVFNAKAQLLTEVGWVPHLSVGAMQLSPKGRSLSLVYASATKTLQFRDDGPSYGRVTLGVGYSANSDTSVFSDSGFVARGQTALIAGYESPSWHRLSLAVDHIGGVSELSSTYAAVVLSPMDNVAWGVGGYLSNDRAAPADGFHTYLSVSFDICKKSQ